MNKKSGFTYTELAMAIFIFGWVSAGTVAVYLTCSKSWYRTDLDMRSARAADLVMQKMTYGIGGTNGIRTAVSTNIFVGPTNAGWYVKYTTPDNETYRFVYDKTNRMITCTNVDNPYVNRLITIATNVVSSSVSTNTSKVLAISVTVGIQQGRFAATNTATNNLLFRN